MISPKHTKTTAVNTVEPVVVLLEVVTEFDWDNGHLTIDIINDLKVTFVITPDSRHESDAEVVAVRPSEADGGVLGTPSLYVP